MPFKHIPNFSLSNLNVEQRETGRFYITPEGKAYPSVTTVLGSAGDKQWYEDWIARVGKETAEKITRQAGRRGTAVHEIAEKYLLNDPDYLKGQMPANISSFKYIKPYLDENVGLIAGLELPLYSDLLRVAGRSDCIAKWKGKWSIIDFKTSKREKKHQDIHNYFMQGACYATMFFERTGKVIPQIVIIITVDDSPAQIFIERAKDWVPKFIELRNKVEL